MTKNVGKLLELSSECELKAAEAYSHFAEKFSLDRDVHSFWNILSKDEIEHARFISQISDELTRDQKAIETRESQWHPVEQLAIYMKDNPYHDIETVQEAYEYTEKIEGYEVTSIVQLIAQECMPESHRTELLYKQLAEHYKMVDEFRNREGSI